MLKQCFLLVGFFIWATSARAESETNVILLTLDGVRLNEVFQGIDPRITGEASRLIMSSLSGPLSNEGVLLGDRTNTFVHVSNSVSLSLPGYQNIFIGHPTRCLTNHCHSVQSETFPEKLVRTLHLDRLSLAGFASWGALANAFEHKKGATFFNAALTPVDLNDPVHQKINQEQINDIPSWNQEVEFGARFDKYTFAHGLHFLKTHHPRFLYIGLLDADEYGHRNDYDSYVKMLQQYDFWIQELIETLKNSGEYGKNTLLIVTTDHGRGGLPSTWKRHGILHPHSRQIWMYVWGKGADSFRMTGQRHYSHNDIRVMVENALKVPN